MLVIIAESRSHTPPTIAKNALVSIIFFPSRFPHPIHILSVRLCVLAVLDGNSQLCFMTMFSALFTIEFAGTVPRTEVSG